MLIDDADEAHWLIYEIWETVEADRSFRAGEGKLIRSLPCWPRRRSRSATSPATSEQHQLKAGIT